MKLFQDQCKKAKLKYIYDVKPRRTFLKHQSLFRKLIAASMNESGLPSGKTLLTDENLLLNSKP